MKQSLIAAASLAVSGSAFGQATYNPALSTVTITFQPQVLLNPIDVFAFATGPGPFWLSPASAGLAGVYALPNPAYNNTFGTSITHNYSLAGGVLAPSFNFTSEPKMTQSDPLLDLLPSCELKILFTMWFNLGPAGVTVKAPSLYYALRYAFPPIPYLTSAYFRFNIKYMNELNGQYMNSQSGNIQVGSNIPGTSGVAIIARPGNAPVLVTPVGLATSFLVSGEIAWNVNVVSPDGAGRGMLNPGELSMRMISLPREGCPCDLNADDYVDDADFVTFAEAYNALVVPDAFGPADFNFDDLVDDSDFVVFAGAYDQLICNL